MGWGTSKLGKMFAEARTESLQKMKELYTPKPAANDNHQRDVGSNQGAPGGDQHDAGGDDGGSGSDSLNAYGLERLESEYGHLSALGKLDTIKQKRLILTGKACSKLLSECAEDGVKISLATWRYIAEGSTEDKSIHIMGTTYVRERGGIVKEIRTDTLKQGRGVMGDTVANAMHRYEGSTLKNVVEGVNRRAVQAMDIVAGNTVGGRLMNAAGELAGEGAQQVGEAALEGLGVDPIDATNATQAALGIAALGRIKVVKPKLGKAAGVAQKGVADKPASTPFGGKGAADMKVKAGTNPPTLIDGVKYSGHALDQMQGRGLTPSVVKGIKESVEPIAGKRAGTEVYYCKTNDITVVYSKTKKQVVTVSHGEIKQ